MSSTAKKKKFFDLVKEGAFHKKEIVLWPMLRKKNRAQETDPVMRSLERIDLDRIQVLDCSILALCWITACRVKLYTANRGKLR